jgi:hypothetical protein
MIETSPLTSRYKMLQRADALHGEGDGRELLRQRELDMLYQQITSLPVISLIDAIDKLAFADHCLMEECDAKEASNLIRAVSAALWTLHHAANNSSDLGVGRPDHRDGRREGSADRD